MKSEGEHRRGGGRREAQGLKKWGVESYRGNCCLSRGGICLSRPLGSHRLLVPPSG